ncbi:MAG: hypothetical protein ACRENJ_02075 [Candidatus Eiseniibacteriota bacterium]
MGINKLFWCNGCRRFEIVEEAGVVNRPQRWLRVELQSIAGTEELHFCEKCAEGWRSAFAMFLRRPGPGA